MESPLVAALDKALQIPSDRIHDHVQTLRRRNPEAGPARVLELLEREYMLLVQGSGGAVGAAATLPGVGTGTAMALTAGDVASFLAASAAFSLAVADVHGIAVEDIERRRALLLTTILGEDGAKTVTDALGLGSARAASSLVTRFPIGTVRSVNNRLARRLLRNQLAKRGGLLLGRLVPFGIGAAVGVAGARALGRTVVEGARATFGPPPERFPTVIEVVGTSPRIGAGAAPAGPEDLGGLGTVHRLPSGDDGRRGILGRLLHRD
ncbi:hypothetical protein [Cellulomonas endophytica]|uniref:hypothetical protein n=1 Tax=Cellulomonas endophytica TaxID=2494735 RepID=UPI001010231A|nr:hypothetical protein [Cellulomonas endophytica]